MPTRAPSIKREKDVGPASYNLNLRVSYPMLRGLKAAYAARRDPELHWQEWLRQTLQRGLR